MHQAALYILSGAVGHRMNKRTGLIQNLGGRIGNKIRFYPTIRVILQEYGDVVIAI